MKISSNSKRNNKNNNFKITNPEENLYSQTYQNKKRLNEMLDNYFKDYKTLQKKYQLKTSPNKYGIIISKNDYEKSRQNIDNIIKNENFFDLNYNYRDINDNVHLREKSSFFQSTDDIENNKIISTDYQKRINNNNNNFNYNYNYNNDYDNERDLNFGKINIETDNMINERYNNSKTNFYNNNNSNEFRNNKFNQKEFDNENNINNNQNNNSNNNVIAEENIEDEFENNNNNNNYNYNNDNIEEDVIEDNFNNNNNNNNNNDNNDIEEDIIDDEFEKNNNKSKQIKHLKNNNNINNINNNYNNNNSKNLFLTNDKFLYDDYETKILHQYQNKILNTLKENEYKLNIIENQRHAIIIQNALKKFMLENTTKKKKIIINWDSNKKENVVFIYALKNEIKKKLYEYENLFIKFYNIKKKKIFFKNMKICKLKGFENKTKYKFNELYKRKGEIFNDIIKIIKNKNI